MIIRTKSIDGSIIDENSNRSTIFDDRSSTPPPPPPPPQPSSSSYNAPQLKFAEDGSIILNEESLVIQRPNIEPVFDSTVIENDRNDNLTYNSYRKFHHTKKWSSKETVKFYRALSMIGTDFTMIQRLFPYRNRDEIKRKFKREEKINQALIDKILSKTAPMDLSVFVGDDDDDDDEESEKEEEKKDDSNENENKKNKKKPYNRYKPKRTKKRAFIEQSSEDDDQKIVKKVNKNLNETINTVVVTSLEEKDMIVEREEITLLPPPPVTTTNDDDDIELVIDLDNDCCEIIETQTVNETNNEEDIVILDLDSNQTIIKQTNPSSSSSSSSSYLQNTNSKLIFVNQPSTSSFQVHVVTPQPSKISNSEIIITQLKK
jgi:FtsZ-interacting cell division protein YlmF